MTAAADQVVHRFVGFAEVGRDSPESGTRSLKVLAEHLEGLADVLANADPGLALTDQGLSSGDRGVPAGVAAVARLAGGRGAGGGELAAGGLQVRAGGLQRGTHLAGEPGRLAEALVDVVFDAGDVAEEVPFVGVPAGPPVPGGVGLDAGRAERMRRSRPGRAARPDPGRRDGPPPRHARAVVFDVGQVGQAARPREKLPLILQRP